MIKYQTLPDMLDDRARGDGAIVYLEGEGAEKTLKLADLRRPVAIFATDGRLDFVPKALVGGTEAGRMRCQANEPALRDDLTSGCQHRKDGLELRAGQARRN